MAAFRSTWRPGKPEHNPFLQASMLLSFSSALLQVRQGGRGDGSGALLLLRGVREEPGHGPRGPVDDGRALLLWHDFLRSW